MMNVQQIALNHNSDVVMMMFHLEDHKMMIAVNSVNLVAVPTV